MKAKWLKMKTTGAARFVYTVVGTAKEIAEYVENQGEYCRFLQEDGTISEEESTTPVFYSTKIVGKNPTLRWDNENERYRAEMSFEDACIMEAVTSAYNPTANSSRTDRVLDEDKTDVEAELDAPVKISKPTSGKRSLKSA